MGAAPRKTTESRRLIVRVEQLRNVQGWSRGDLAERMTAAGYPTARNRIDQWGLTTGNVALTADQIVALVAVFGMTYDEFFAVKACTTCGGRPPSGFICADCGRSSTSLDADDD